LINALHFRKTPNFNESGDYISQICSVRRG
jgi:hypothetical protein